MTPSLQQSNCTVSRITRLIVLGMLLLLFPAMTSAEIIDVCGDWSLDPSTCGGDYGTIQEGVNAAGADDEVRVLDSLAYDEQVSIEKRIRLYPEQGDHPKLQKDTTPTLNISGDNFQFQGGFTVNFTGDSEGTALLIQGSSGANTGSHWATNNNFQSNIVLDAEGSNAKGLYLKNADNLRITDTTINTYTTTSTGIYLEEASTQNHFANIDLDTADGTDIVLASESLEDNTFVDIETPDGSNFFTANITNGADMNYRESSADQFINATTENDTTTFTRKGVHDSTVTLVNWTDNIPLNHHMTYQVSGLQANTGFAVQNNGEHEHSLRSTSAGDIGPFTIIGGSDHTISVVIDEAPNWTVLQTNSSAVVEGNPLQLQARWIDDFNLKNWTLYWNHSGTWQDTNNDTFTGTVNWSNATETVTTPGTYVYGFNAFDQAVNINKTFDQINNTFTVRDIPDWHNPQDNSSDYPNGEVPPTQPVELKAKATDQDGLDDPGHEVTARLYTNASTGDFHEVDSMSLSGTSNWSNFTHSFSEIETVGWYINYTSSEGVNQTPVNAFPVTTDTPQTRNSGDNSSQYTGGVPVGEPVEMRAQGRDDDGGINITRLWINKPSTNGYIISTPTQGADATGTWVWRNFTRSFDSSDVGTVNWKIEFEDSFGAASNTSEHDFTVVDTEPPQWVPGSVFHNKTGETVFAGDVLEFAANWTDNIDLSHARFTWNKSGTMTNVSLQTLTTNPDWSNHTEKITASMTRGTFKWRFWANDTATPDNWNVTDIHTFTVEPIGNKPPNQVPPPQAQFTPDYTNYHMEIDDVTPMKLAVTNDLAIKDTINVTFTPDKVSYTVDTSTTTVNATGNPHRYQVNVGSKDTVNMLIDVTASQTGGGELDVDIISTKTEQTDRDTVAFTINPKTEGRFVSAPALTPLHLVVVFLLAAALLAVIEARRTPRVKHP